MSRGRQPRGGFGCHARIEPLRVVGAACNCLVSQDDEAFARVQEGLRSQFAPRGPVSTREPILTGFNKWLLDRYAAYERVD